jgi:hypothetical protein
MNPFIGSYLMMGMYMLGNWQIGIIPGIVKDQNILWELGKK